MDTDIVRQSMETHDPELLREVYSQDVLFDAHVPNWHFQVRGREAVIGVIRNWYPHAGHFHRWSREYTASGDVLVEFDWREDTPAGEITVHQLHLWRLENQRISVQQVYCAGRWDEQLVERMRPAVPLVLS